MDALETLVRDVLREHAADAPTEVPSVVERRPHRWLYAGLAAALVAALAVALAVWPRSTQSHPAAQPSVVPHGYREISYNGISLAVPNGLSRSSLRCASPGILAVDPGMSTAGCPTMHPPRVLLEPFFDTPGGPMITHQMLRTIDGKAALRSTSDTFLEIRDPGVIVWLDGLPAATRRVILDSVRVTRVDRNGCPSAPKFAANAAGEPVAASLCVYSDARRGERSFLVASAEVPSSKLPGLVGQARAGYDLAAGPSAFARFGYADGSFRFVPVPWAEYEQSLVR